MSQDMHWMKASAEAFAPGLPSPPATAPPGPPADGGARESNGNGHASRDDRVEHLKTSAIAETRGRDAANRRLLAVADALAGVIALYAGVAVIGHDQLTPLVLLTAPLTVLIAKVVGLYDRDELTLSRSTLDEAPSLFNLAALYMLAIWLLDGVVVIGELGRDQVIGCWALVFVLLLALRSCARAVVPRFAPPERCLVVGTGADVKRLRERLSESDHARVEIVGTLLLDDQVDAAGRFVHDQPPWDPRDHPTLDWLIAVKEASRVIVIPPNAGDSEAILDVIRHITALGVKASVQPGVRQVIGTSAEIDEVDGLLLLGVKPFGLSRSSRLLKRSMDLVGAVAATALAAPIMCAIAIAIKLDSPGPVFFRQRRIAKDGRDIEVLKFRTMMDGADAMKAQLLHLNESEGLFKLSDDPRVTRVGDFLRRTALDELPQLFNVLRGEMSLVGPRPLVPEEDQLLEGWRRRRLHITPGMTGVWQLLGSRRVPLAEMASLDYVYVATWSLWLDVKIMLRTAAHVLRRRGI
jgi:exopolysaccharide biosynthesis polyprenyl glycosylphosphotransferase